MVKIPGVEVMAGGDDLFSAATWPGERGKLLHPVPEFMDRGSRGRGSGETSTERFDTERKMGTGDTESLRLSGENEVVMALELGTHTLGII